MFAFTLLDLVAFLYFSIKNHLLYRRFKIFNKNISLLFSFFIGVFSVLQNQYLVNRYEGFLGMSFVRGAIELPPFLLLLIGADVFSTIVLLFLVTLSRHRNRKPPAALLEITRLLFVYVFFTFLVTNFWMKSIKEKQFNWNYECFKIELRKDLARYYFQNGRFPNDISKASKLTINPLNGADLVVKNPESVTSYTIVDTFENKIIVASRDFIGIASYKDNPEFFMEYLNLLDNSLCENGRSY